MAHSLNISNDSTIIWQSEEFFEAVVVNTERDNGKIIEISLQYADNYIGIHPNCLPTFIKALQDINKEYLKGK